MAKKTAYLGLFAALAILFGYVESLIPLSLFIPGIKLGLCNLVIVFVLYKFSVREALLVSVIRILVIGFMFGNLMSILFSLGGGLLSLFCMELLKRTGNFSVCGVSIFGGTMHNMGQMLIAMMVIPGKALLFYLPVLCIVGAFTGLLIGIISMLILKRFEKADSWRF